MIVSKKKITALMGSNLMTQKNLAEKAGVCRMTICSTLIRDSCSTATAGKIAKALGVTPAEIIEMED